MQVASVCGGMYSNWTDGMCTLRTNLSDLCGHMLVLYVSLHAHQSTLALRCKHQQYIYVTGGCLGVTTCHHMEIAYQSGTI